MKVMSIEELHQKLVNHEIDVKEYYQELFAGLVVTLF